MTNPDARIAEIAERLANFQEVPLGWMAFRGQAANDIAFLIEAVRKLQAENERLQTLVAILSKPGPPLETSTRT